jgi:hypothetical protein
MAVPELDPGIVPAIHVFLGSSRVQVFVQVAPVGIGSVDETYIPSARFTVWILRYTPTLEVS